jgi:hypothetical protein
MIEQQVRLQQELQWLFTRNSKFCERLLGSRNTSWRSGQALVNKRSQN